LKEVRTILKNLGFEPRPQGASSHQQWVADSPFRKVTVDPPKEPFGHDLIKSMARQAGVGVRDFYAALDR
jgi:predicted RNA binding protein YcfA (HicA-like mRNA interferase family)